MRILGNNVRALELIIALNALIFVIEVFAISTGSTGFIFKNFALTPASIMQEPWTIITSMFLHADAWHLFFNMFVLYFFGMYLERLVGENNLLKTYFLGGILAGIAYLFTSFAFNIPPPHISAIGASGAVFAVMGALVVLRPRLALFVFPFPFPMPLYVWTIIYTFMALTDMMTSMGGVAHNAHLGGLIAGIYFGMQFKKKMITYVQEYYPRRYF
ncbi:MAG: rhomboid family intramembrane serine protease [Thermoprotei archaeon]|nr:MAG: rhomboid family intramembrane serine protease [Thermoprotei archaeon]